MLAIGIKQPNTLTFGLWFPSGGRTNNTKAAGRKN
jgi:hypothetical protein